MYTHTVAAVILELAYLGVGLLLCVMGKRLLEKGVEGRTKVEGQILGGKWALLTSSPGIVFAVCGLGIIIYAIVTPSVYEEKVYSTHVSEPSSTQTVRGTGDLTAATTTETSSRLLEQLPENTLLTSSVAIYALQHRYLTLPEKDVATDIQQMPTQAGVEPWSQTYERFRDVLRKNPAALLEMMKRSEFRWLASKDREDRALSNLVKSELEQLSSSSP